MFGKKQEYTKELEEKLNTAESQIEILQSKIKQLENSSRQMPSFFESQIIAQSDMDKELTKVESKAHDAMEASSESGQAYEQFAIEFTSMRGQLEEEEAKKKELMEALLRQKKQLDAVIDEKKYLTTPAELLQQAQGHIANDMQEIYNQLHEMQEFSKQMSALALNCAIEAGRLGESGKQFIGAAEDVRQLSNSYERAAEAIRGQMDGIKEQVDQMEEQAGKLTEALEQDEHSMSHLSKIHAEAEDLCRQTTEQAYSEKALALTAILKKISQTHESIASLQRQSISGMQLIGASLKEEQEARKEMERIYEQMEQNMRH